MAYEIEGFDFEKHIDNLVDSAKRIRPGEVTVLTGPNGYGKSLIRKVLPQALEKGHGVQMKVASISMERRTQKNHDFGALGSIAIDQPHDATSNHSCDMIRMILQETERYIVIDEPEIGMGKEMLLGVIDQIKEWVEKQRSTGNFKGLLVITHSEFFIENFPHDRFVNLEGLTFEKWKRRPVAAVTPDALSKWCHKLYLAIEKRMKDNKDK